MVMNPRTHPRGARPDFTLPRRNPNPDRMTDALWWLVCMRMDLEPDGANGGTLALKPGYHSYGSRLPDHGLGDPRTDHSIRRAPDREGPWWRGYTSAHDWTFRSAQAGNYATISKYTKRLINAMRDPDDLRPDWVYAYTLGQVDGDVTVEGYNEYRDEAEVSGDKTHLWHRHDSFRRNIIGNFWAMWKALTIDMGWSYDEWLRSTQPVEAQVVTQFNADDKAELKSGATQGVLNYTGGGLPADLPPGSNLLAYFREKYNRDKAQDAEVDQDLDTLGAYSAALMNDVAALIQDPADMADPEQHPIVRAVRYALDNPTA